MLQGAYKVRFLQKLVLTNRVLMLNLHSITNTMETNLAMECIQGANVQFSPQSLQILNVILGFIMFGIALDLRPKDFRLVFQTPKSVFTGLFSQLLLLPAFTLGLVYLCLNWGIIDPCLGLGMILIAACPGGNISNFMTKLAGGNVALSVTMTAVVTLGAVVTTPFNFTFWGGLHPETAQLIQEINLNLFDLFKTVFVLLGLPLIGGMLFNNRLPKITAKIVKPIKIFSILFFVGFLIVALYTNFDAFKDFFLQVVPAVFLHNAAGIIGALVLAKLMRLNSPDTRCITIETCIQNSGVALVLIFTIFAQSSAHTGMALIAACWGIWHIVAGLTIAFVWTRVVGN